MVRVILAVVGVMVVSAAADAQLITSSPVTCTALPPRPGPVGVGIEAKGVWAAPVGPKAAKITRIELTLGIVSGGTTTVILGGETISNPVQAQTATTPYAAKFMAQPVPPPPNAPLVKAVGAGTYSVKAKLFREVTFLGFKVGEEEVPGVFSTGIVVVQ